MRQATTCYGHEWKLRRLNIDTGLRLPAITMMALVTTGALKGCYDMGQRAHTTEHYEMGYVSEASGAFERCSVIAAVYCHLDGAWHHHFSAGQNCYANRRRQREGTALLCAVIE